MAPGGFQLLWLLPVLLRVHSQCGETAKPLCCQKTRLYVLCRDCDLSVFPRGLDPSVQLIDASHNFITNLTVSDTSDLTQLVHVDLSSNRLQLISERALVHLVHLHSFILASNNLNQNYLSNGKALLSLWHLGTLDLSANKLESDMAASYLRSLPSLQQLDLSRNHITRLSVGFFRGVPRLREINLEYNYIVEIEEGTFALLRELHVLNLAMNSLLCLSTFSLTQLWVLNLSHNALQFFVAGGKLDEAYQLQTLDLSYNQLAFLPLLPRRSSIRQLNLSHNAIACLAGNSTTAEEFTLKSHKQVRPSVSWSVSGTARSLRDLDLSSNQLGSFPLRLLRGLSSLHTLRLASNCLQDGLVELTRDCRLLHPMPPPSRSGAMHRITLPSLKRVYLQGNAIHYLPPRFFDLLPNLEVMDLSFNRLHLCRSSSAYKEEPCLAGRKNCTAFNHMRHLRHLSLRGNNLSVLPSNLFHQTALTSLDVSENRGLFMLEGTLEGLESSLEKLSLRGNQMGSSEVTLPCLKGLKIVDLSDNKLSNLPPSLACSSLEKLDIRKNCFLRLEEVTARDLAGSLQYLVLTGNPFNCCELQWLEIMEASSVTILDLDKALCFYRGIYKNLTALVTAKDTLYPCLHSTHNANLSMLVVALFCFLLLTFVLYFSLKALRFIRNRVAPVPSPSCKTKGQDDIAVL
uniref:Uncharacterized protein n=1 Tax=Salvator merianae TaxID=96440 RepID=A0A8D0BGJ2_SALMN